MDKKEEMPVVEKQKEKQEAYERRQVYRKKQCEYIQRVVKLQGY